MFHEFSVLTRNLSQWFRTSNINRNGQLPTSQYCKIIEINHLERWRLAVVRSTESEYEQ